MHGITRRSFLAGAATVSALRNISSFAETDVPPAGAIVLEDDRLRALFDRKSGSLLTLENKQSGWRIQDRIQFGAGFRMQVPIPKRHYHFVTEKDNPPRSVEVQPGNNGVTFVWGSLKSPHAGILDITLRASVLLTDSGLVFTTDVDNRSGLPVESLGYPILGDMLIPSRDSTLYQGSWGYGVMARSQLFPKFTNQVGYFGTDYPMQAVLTPESQFVLIFADSEGLYAGYHDSDVQTMARFQFELEPAYADSLDSAVEDGTLHKDFSRISFQIIQFPYAGPGQRKKSPPIVLRPYQGTWHRGADIYKECRKTWFTAPVSPAWVNDVH